MNYVVGDLQGCLDPLLALLDRLKFDPAEDRLWSVGDIVNRGPQSLETLRYLKGLGDRFAMTLGNHDLHLLAVAYGYRSANNKDTLNAILKAPDREELLHWLQQQPLLLSVDSYTLVHAGIPPQWTLSEAFAHATEVETVLRNGQAGEYFATMYGNDPNCWDPNLEGPARWRVITNYLTRMRFCTAKGKLDLTNKSSPNSATKGYAPWFSHANRKTRNDKLVFGHWASLEGKLNTLNLYPLDTGYVWGGRLRILALESGEFFHIEAK